MKHLEGILLFSDGACSGNPGPGGWATILVFPEGRVQELGGRSPQTTNNRMEIAGVLRGLDELRKIYGAKPIPPIHVLTDSTYVIRGITQWIWGWRKRGWKTAAGEEVANQDLWQLLSEATKGLKIEWKYVRGHNEIPGNERVDTIAVAFSQGGRPSLYEGPLLKYSVAIYDLPESFEIPEQRPREQKAAAYSYLSLVGGTAQRHSSWAECERRVKGVSGAKFKKTTSAEEEAQILSSWGAKLVGNRG